MDWLSSLFFSKTPIVLTTVLTRPPQQSECKPEHPTRRVTTELPSCSPLIPTINTILYRTHLVSEGYVMFLAQYLVITTSNTGTATTSSNARAFVHGGCPLYGRTVGASEPDWSSRLCEPPSREAKSAGAAQVDLGRCGC